LAAFARTAFARFALASYASVALPHFFVFGLGFRFRFFLAFGLPSFSPFLDRPLAAFPLAAFHSLLCLPLRHCIWLLRRVSIGALFGFCFGFHFVLHTQYPFAFPSGIFLVFLSRGNFVIPRVLFSF
jgi:hypothetical protein